MCYYIFWRFSFNITSSWANWWSSLNLSDLMALMFPSSIFKRDLISSFVIFWSCSSIFCVCYASINKDNRLIYIIFHFNFISSFLWSFLCFFSSLRFFFFSLHFVKDFKLIYFFQILYKTIKYRLKK